jgi:hypothetical protein
MTCVIEPNPAQVFSWQKIISTMFFTLHNRKLTRSQRDPAGRVAWPYGARSRNEKRATDHGN